MINLPLSPIENKSLFVMSDMLLDADVTAALKKIFGHKLFSHNLPCLPTDPDHLLIKVNKILALLKKYLIKFWGFIQFTWFD